MKKKNATKISKNGASPKNSGLLKNISKEQINTAKAENDYYRRQLMEKQVQINALEKRAPRLEELRILLTHLVLDFQENGQYNFIDPVVIEANPEKLQQPFETAGEGIQMVRNGINDFISNHQRLASRFELEFSKNIFSLNQKLEEKKKLLAKEEELLDTANIECSHKQNVIDIIVNEKNVLKRTIIMLREKLERHVNSNSAQLGIVQGRFEKAKNELDRVQNLIKVKDDESIEINNRQEEKIATESRQALTHQELLQTAETLRADFKNESHSHNITRAALDRAKGELTNLARAVESYHDNLKTQELLDAEVENKRLRSVINIEKIDFDEKLERHTKKTKELSEVVDHLTLRIDQLNSQISSTEQKLQTQMMRIPDFEQLSQVLDRSLAQTQKYKEFVLKRKYLLDEIRDKNRLLEQMEIQESKNRMAQLKVLMPLANEQKDEESVLPTLLEEHMKWQSEMKELLTSTGF